MVTVAHLLCILLVLNLETRLNSTKGLTVDKSLDLKKSRIKIGGSRFIVPGDFVVHEEYGYISNL